MLKSLEKKWRIYRDKKIIEPLVRSHAFQKHIKVNAAAIVYDFGSHFIACDPNDSMAGWLRDHGGWFREETMRIFDALPKCGGVFVDVGANIGTQTIYAMMLGGFDHAVCFEPDPQNAWLLKTNAAINGFADRMTIIEAGAGSSTSTATLSKSNRHHGTHSFAVRHNDGGDTITLPIVRVEDELARIGVSRADVGLAWIDVEGYEGEVLKGWPSVVGVPLCIEYSPDVNILPGDTFKGWSEWADARETTIRWQPIEKLDIPSYVEQVDLLLK